MSARAFNHGYRVSPNTEEQAMTLSAPTTQSRSFSRTSKAVLTGALLLGATTLGGCDNAGQGLFSGAALGALTGLALGSLSGNAGEGAVAGTIIGGAGGAILGDVNQRERENSRYRGSDHRYDHRYDSRYNQRSHSSRGYQRSEWWEEEWCD